MSGAIQVSRLRFAAAPASRFVPFRSRRETSLSLTFFVVILVVAVALQLWTHDPFVWLLLFVPLLVSAGMTVLRAEPARFSLHGDAAAAFEYLDQLMRAAPEYLRSKGAAGEILYTSKGNGRFADARSYCVLAVRGEAVEVRGSRDILRRLRFWSTHHFSQA